MSSQAILQSITVGSHNNTQTHDALLGVYAELQSIDNTVQIRTC